jgi:riboflavin kinase/FMN adenylyltransferase
MNIYRNLQEIPEFNKAVITIGSFDGVHIGHQRILERVRLLASETGGESVVITFHPHPRKVIYPKDDSLKLLTTTDEKLELLKKYNINHICILPFTVEFAQLHPAEYIENFLIKSFNPAYIVIGYDHRFGINRGGDITMLKSYEEKFKFNVIEIPALELEEIRISSTKIRSALDSGDIREANRYLNHPYILSGKVVHGDKLGAKLGYPTANINIPAKDKLIPKAGVYAVIVDIYGDRHNGMLYIGKRPTLAGQQFISVEVHLFDFNQDIYDQFVTIMLIDHLRDDIKFENLEALKNQLALDEKDAGIRLETYSNTKNNKAKVTLAILNYNGQEYLESFLPMMMFSSSRYETNIIVIDNYSTDGSVDYIREWHPEIQVIELTKNYGFADGYNKGIKDIDSEYIAFMNSDVLVLENWIDPVVALMDEDKNIGAAQPLVLSLEEKSEFEYAGAAGGYLDALGYPFCRGRIFDRLEKNTGQYNGNTEIFWASGAALVTRVKLFNNIGGFDPSYFAHHEEIDYCWRIKRAGYKVIACGESKVYHMGGGTLAYDNPHKTFLNFKNNLLTLLKNESISKLIFIFIIRLFLDGIAGIKFLIEGKAGSAMAIIKAHFRIYTLFPEVFKECKQSDNLILRNKINQENNAGRYKGLIIWDYFIAGRKYFSDLNIK